jgi:hypothetical protein
MILDSKIIKIYNNIFMQYITDLYRFIFIKNAIIYSLIYRVSTFLFKNKNER